MSQRNVLFSEVGITRYAGLSNEELIRIISEAEEPNPDAYIQLFRNLAPIILHEAAFYRHKMDIYDTDDFLQEGMILAWQLVTKEKYQGKDSDYPNPAKFSKFFCVVIRRRLARIYENYILRNPVYVWEEVDLKGNATRILAKSYQAEYYREQRRQWDRARRERLKAAEPPKPEPPPKPQLTPEEKMTRLIAKQKEYYRTHPDKLEARRAHARAYQKARYQAQKLAVFRQIQESVKKEGKE